MNRTNECVAFQETIRNMKHRVFHRQRLYMSKSPGFRLLRCNRAFRFCLANKVYQGKD